MKILAILLVTAALLTGCKVGISDNSADNDPVDVGTVEPQAIVAKVANTFLERLDAGATDETWPMASPRLHDGSNQNTWSGGIRIFRGRVGAFESRTLKGFEFTLPADGVPNGDYIAVGFDTTFSNSAAEEKVVLHKDHGEWKVMDYVLTRTLQAQL